MTLAKLWSNNREVKKNGGEPTGEPSVGPEKHGKPEKKTRTQQSTRRDRKGTKRFPLFETPGKKNSEEEKGDLT